MTTEQQHAAIDALAAIPVDWEPEKRAYPPELEPDYEAAPYPPPATKFAPWTEQLEHATAEILHLYAAGGTGTLNYRHTEIGDE